MKLRMYSVEEYRDELGGAHAARGIGFAAATKAYRQLDDEWYDYAPRKAADVLQLAPEASSRGAPGSPREEAPRQGCPSRRETFCSRRPSAAGFSPGSNTWRTPSRSHNQ